MRKNTTKIEVLKRRIKAKKKQEPEAINPFHEFASIYAHITAYRYLDSDRFATYEVTFPITAREFFQKSGADMYNHDALDHEINQRVTDEHKFIDEQFENHIAVINDLKVGVEVEKTAVQTKIEQCNRYLEALRNEREELRSLYRSHNRKDD